MKPMSQRGFTTIELLVCFIVVSAISISLFGVVMNFKERQQVASIRSDVTTYKNTLTKTIMDDVAKNKINYVYSPDGTNTNIYIVYSDGEYSSIQVNPTTNTIRYSSKKSYYNMISSYLNYPLPAIPDLSIDQANYFVIDSTNRFVTINIPFLHPDLKNRDYGIHIVFPY